MTKTSSRRVAANAPEGPELAPDLPIGLVRCGERGEDVRVIGSPSRASFALVLVFVTLPACGCEETVDCYPAGTYVDVDADLGTSTARICFDERCETLTSKNTPDDPILSFDTPYWDEGSSFELSIEVFDPNGTLIDSIAEQRTMDSNAEACGVLQYGWTDGRLTRIN